MFKKNIFRVGDVSEEEGVAGDRGACGTAVFLLDDFTELLDGQYTTPDIKKGAHYGTNHIAEETVSCDGELPLNGGDLCPFSVHDAAGVGLHVSVEL